MENTNTNNTIYTFLDDELVSTQIKKTARSREGIYAAKTVQSQIIEEDVLIGVSDDTMMGTGDIGSATEMDYAVYR